MSSRTQGVSTPKSSLGSVLIVTDPKGGGVSDYVQVVAARMDADVRVAAFHADLEVTDATVLLQYSGYGYSPRGTPLHLLAWVQRQRLRMRRFGVYFHELYASSRNPASSVFWLSPLQKHIARSLARTSDFWLSNTEDSTAWLERHAGNRPHLRLPIPSNVGEADAPPNPRERAVVIFGGESLRAETYRAAGDALFRWAAAERLVVHDVGSTLRDPTLHRTLQAHGVQIHGRLPIDAVHELMGKAMFGVVRYPTNCVAKSGVFASYCAHGMAPVLMSEMSESFDGLRAGEHYLAGVPGTRLSDDTVLSIARSAFDWYQGHSIDAHAQAVQTLVNAA